MSGNKLNQSLDDILTERRSKNKPRGNGAVGRRARTAKPSAAPVGGVRKNTKGSKATDKIATPTGPSRGVQGKIILSNLPYDATKSQIKDYLQTTIGPVKKVDLSHDDLGRFLGKAEVVFKKYEDAEVAANKLHNLLVDHRRMQIEWVSSPSAASAPAPVKTLSERIAKPKPAAKEKAKAAAAATTKGAPAARGARSARGKGRGGRVGRGKPKTAEEQD